MTGALRAEIAPTGTLRAAINFGNPVLAQRDANGGAPRGVSPDLARELARRLELPLAYVGFTQAGQVVDALARGVWDVAFLAVDPKRAADIAFTAPYVRIEGAYMVPAGSPLHGVDAVDADGVRIAVVEGSAYDLHLTRTLRKARLVRAPGNDASLAAFEREGLEALAGIRSPLLRYAQSRPDLRVIDGRFMVIEQAMAVPRNRPGATRYLDAMLAELKGSGFVADALRRSGQGDARVAD